MLKIQSITFSAILQQNTLTAVHTKQADIWKSGLQRNINLKFLVGYSGQLNLIELFYYNIQITVDTFQYMQFVSR